MRTKAGMTQTVFANYMGVSKKTVEAWECGRTHPTGPASRLLAILAAGKEKELSFVSIK
ncbi:MAG: helix-turn-helix domain-containing protein [Eubacteriales bacterium]|nr:helix-turn-helix domain-containing protein [Eubacteriales bacterium]